MPTLHKPTESGPKPLQCRSAHRRNASASSKPNHCRPPFPPWYWFGVAEFAPVGFPTLCCGASQGGILRSPHRFGSSRKTKTVIGPLFGGKHVPSTLSIEQALSDRFESSSIGLPASRCGARVGLCGQCKILLPSWEPEAGITLDGVELPTPPKLRKPRPASGAGGVPAPVQRRRRVCYATPLQEVGSDPDRIVFQWTRTWSWPKLMGCAKPRGAPQVAPVPTLQKPTESGPKPLQCRSAHRRNASASSKPNHCRPPFPPWYWFGVAEFAPVGFPTLCCGARVGSCGHRTVLGRAEKRKLS